MRLTAVALVALLLFGHVNWCSAPFVIYVPFFELLRPVRALITLRLLRRPFPMTRRLLRLFLVPMLLGRRQDDPSIEVHTERLHTALQKVDSEECLYRLLCELQTHSPNGEKGRYSPFYKNQSNRPLPLSTSPHEFRSEGPVIEVIVKDHKVCERTKDSCPYSAADIMSSLQGLDSSESQPVGQYRQPPNFIQSLPVGQYRQQPNFIQPQPVGQYRQPANFIQSQRVGPYRQQTNSTQSHPIRRYKQESDRHSKQVTFRHDKQKPVRHDKQEPLRQHNRGPDFLQSQPARQRNREPDSFRSRPVQHYKQEPDFSESQTVRHYKHFNFKNIYINKIPQPS